MTDELPDNAVPTRYRIPAEDDGDLLSRIDACLRQRFDQMDPTEYRDRLDLANLGEDPATISLPIRRCLPRRGLAHRQRAHAAQRPRTHGRPHVTGVGDHLEDTTRQRPLSSRAIYARRFLHVGRRHIATVATRRDGLCTAKRGGGVHRRASVAATPQHSTDILPSSDPARRVTQPLIKSHGGLVPTGDGQVHRVPAEHDRSDDHARRCHWVIHEP
jgi:hypothetical protein